METHWEDSHHGLGLILREQSGRMLLCAISGRLQTTGRHDLPVDLTEDHPVAKLILGAFRPAVPAAPQVELGQSYRDVIHGFVGVATGRTVYLTGCARVILEALDGSDIKSYTFDETQLALEPAIADAPSAKVEPELATDISDKPGGPRPAPAHKAVPSRH